MSYRRKVNAVMLCALGMIVMATVFDSHAADSKPIRVALFDDKGSAGKGVPNVSNQLGKISDIKLTELDGDQISNGSLKDFDVVIFTGGRAGEQATSLGEKGREEVRKFVQQGGGYVGICAGAYLACSGGNMLGILNAKSAPKWRRGKGMVKIEVTPLGEQSTSLPAKIQEVLYNNGPILTPDQREDLPKFETLAFYRTEMSKMGATKGAMVNTPAIVSGSCGKGRVMISGPHPEQTAGMEKFVERAVKWVAGKENPKESNASDSQSMGEMESSVKQP
jgi:glutamine amidotransferase-like uncharacterized protein